jgi:class 3 adenylate cyclase/tetratricopeptide (TPR) repeat protein
VTVCAECGRDNPADARFCNACGAALAAPTPAQEQRKTVTVLFTDVTGSTQLGERLDPESLRQVLARFFETARGVVERHGGTVEKFVGDAVMAVFGIPRLHEDDALRAVRAAADLADAVRALNETLERDYGTTLQLRTGINTGEVVTGTSERLATGDAVNVAARLEQLAEPGEVLLGEPTVRLVRHTAQVENRPSATLKGKALPVAVFRLVSVSAAATSRPMDSPMVGRTGQLHQLSEAFAHSVRDGACNLFTLLGTAGVGKSRLVSEFLGQVDATVLRGRCLSYGEGITYWPVVEMLKQLPEEQLTAFLGEHRDVAAAVGALLGDDSVAATSADIAWAVRRLFEHVASAGPLVVVFDDLHWAEPTLMDLVEHVTDLSRDRPILLLCVARPELLDRRPGWGGGKFNATTVLLEPLTADETDELIGGLFPDLEPSVRTKVRDVAAGNPLFVEEMLALVETGGVGVTVPPTIQALLAARLDQLDPAERRVLESGSVEGKSFHRGAVQALDPDEREVQARLIGLVRKDLVRPDRPTLPGEDAFRFRHLLIRDAAYDGLPKSVRAGLHERFAHWLDEHGTDLIERDEIVGYHLEQAFRYRRELGPIDAAATALATQAGDRLATAGRRAALREDLPSAINLLERAVALSPVDSLDTRVELAYCDVLFDAGRLPDALARVDLALDRARSAGRHLDELVLRLRRGVFLLHADPEGRLDELRTLVEEARPVVEASGDDAAQAHLWAAATHVRHFEVNTVEQLTTALRALEFARRAGEPQLVWFAQTMVATAVVYGPTPVEEGLAWLRRVADEAPIPPPFFVGWQGYLLTLAGRIDEGRALFRQAAQMCDERGLVLPAAIMAQQTWHVEMVLGDPVAAERIVRAGCEQLERMSEKSFLSTQVCQLALSLYELGRDDEARQLADRGAELAAQDDAYTQVLCRRVWMKVAARRGDHDTARRFVDEALSWQHRTDDPIGHGELALDIAETWSLAGDAEAAAAQCEKAVESFRAKGATLCVARAQRRLERLRTPGAH